MVDPISVLSAVDLCIKYGTKLAKICSGFKHAQTEVMEQILRIKHCWIRIQEQLKVVRSIVHDLSEEHREIQEETLTLLVVRLEVVIMRIKSITKSDPSTDNGVRVQRGKYAFLQHKIQDAIEDLERWQRLYDPSWYLIIKIANPQIDVDLKSYGRSSSTGIPSAIPSARLLRSALSATSRKSIRIFLPEGGLESLEIHSIPLSSALVARRSNPAKSLILERFECYAGMNAQQLEKNVEDLAKKLYHSNARDFGLLNCKGVIKHYQSKLDTAEPSAFTFVFRIPGFSQPRSLRSRLHGMKTAISLSERFSIASELARSVSTVHAFGFVHKNIRPETILLLVNEQSSAKSAFLIGFDAFRPADGETLRKGDLLWEKSLYQHPSRMGLMATEDYTMQHDIYSLGVCLLELGLCESFVSYDNPMSDLPNNDESTNASRTPILGTGPQVLFKERLLSLARGELKHRMGSRYSDVVVICLTCLDPNNDFGDETEFQDADDVQVGVRYIEKVIMQLESICV